jgi:ferric-dicitrate binding protein FerR (iron transport regulator)
MKSIDELLIAWRDETITAEELKELERLLAEPGAREQLFDEFLTTAAITEALTVEAKAKTELQPRQPKSKWPVSRFLPWAAAAVVLLAAGAAYFISTAPSASSFQIVAGVAMVDQKKNGPIVENSLVESEAGDSATIRFPDGSSMELAPASSSVVHRRSVDLKAGKASFDVQHVQNAHGNADAFSVKTPVGTVTVSGTKFTVELKPKGQSSSEGTQTKSSAVVLAVSVEAGSVSVNYDGTNHVLSMGQSQAFGADDAPALPPALKGFNGTVNGVVVRVGKDSIVVMSTALVKMGVKKGEVEVIVKDVKDLPELKVNNLVYATVSEVDGHLVATKVIKGKSSK